MLIITRAIAPGTPKIPTINDVIRFSPICILQKSSIKLITKISIAPKN